ncbi:ankyrin repeat domain-containing protein [Hydrogenophaga laconesensis]|uniref:Ankyrin repeat protein n=1 Tax=Hydrogenophaga laconesensis TaxID=1805971 RepID=A0ABU1V931_9BURK|nr:ankyrin repeat domain-containing protein [Hydrogenophaga laconesensis]MDR7093833.1 ankyrin repeat protein [Hydrogenophaga laconesensis]
MIKASGWPLAPELLTAPDADFNARLEGGLVPLHWACTEGKAGLVAFMLERGADVLDAADGAVSVAGRTPLYMAIHSGNFQTVMLVIDRLKAIGAPPADEALKKRLTGAFAKSHADAKNRLAQTLKDWDRIGRKAPTPPHAA